VVKAHTLLFKVVTDSGVPLMVGINR